jgi:hypothetical protein
MPKTIPKMITLAVDPAPGELTVFENTIDAFLFLCYRG